MTLKLWTRLEHTSWRLYVRHMDGRAKSLTKAAWRFAWKRLAKERKRRGMRCR